MKFCDLKLGDMFNFFPNFELQSYHLTIFVMLLHKYIGK